MRFTKYSTIFAALALAACGDSNPDAVDYDAVARVVGPTIATSDGGGTLGAVHDSLTLAFGGMPAGFTYENGMAFGSHGAVHHEYTMIACRDRDNHLLRTCNSQTNTAILVATWSGVVHLPALDLTTSRQDMWTLTGLQSWMEARAAMPTLTGSSEVRCDATFDGGASYEVIASESESMLATSQLMGGTIHLDLDVTRTGTPAIAIVAEVTFDSPDSALLVLDETHLYRVDLATGVAERPTR